MRLVKNKKNNRGFTLLEMLISISLFTMVTTVAFSALYAILDANGKAKTTKTIINNLSMSIESMTREIRVGSEYKKVGIDGKVIEFKSKDDKDYSYKIDGGEIVRKIGSGSEPWISITGSDIKITNNSKFKIAGNSSVDKTQPRVLILIEGEVKGVRSKINTTFNIQTTVSQRNPDV